MHLSLLKELCHKDFAVVHQILFEPKKEDIKWILKGRNRDSHFLFFFFKGTEEEFDKFSLNILRRNPFPSWPSAA